MWRVRSCRGVWLLEFKSKGRGRKGKRGVEVKRCRFVGTVELFAALAFGVFKEQNWAGCIIGVRSLVVWHGSRYIDADLSMMVIDVIEKIMLMSLAAASRYVCIASEIATRQ